MQSRSELLADLENSHSRMQALLTSLAPERLDIAYHPGVNPPLWEAGHTAFFYETFVFAELDRQASFDPSMDDLWDSFQVGHAERWSRDYFPDREATLRYTNWVYQRMRERILSAPLDARSHYLYRYAIAHQNMHIESMIWARQTAGYPAPSPASGLAAAVDDAAPSAAEEDVTIPAGRWWIGQAAQQPAWEADCFAFDNEKPGFEIELPAFSISRYLTSNGEFRAFVEDGGYERLDYWSHGGRRWLRDAGQGVLADVDRVQQPVRHPLYWRYHEGRWQQRLFDAWHDLEDGDAVRHISYWEAEAWCRWAGRRLPNEFEWEVAALGNRCGSPKRRYPWGNAMQASRVHMDAEPLAGLPVDALSEGDSPFGVRQMLGSLWEWTGSGFMPFSGFTADVYPFMSVLQFGDHVTTRGGSCATSRLLIRGSYRQAYHPDRYDVFVGFRSCPL